MSVTLRKLVATVALILLVVVYAPLAMEIGARVASRTGGLGQLVYFVVAGLAWILPAGLIVAWAWRPRPPRDPGR
jgi:hypothetical protein